MEETLPRYLKTAALPDALSAAHEEVVLLPNPPGVFPRWDVAVLGPKVLELTEHPAAIFVDMDGTTTMTEDLCLDALDFAVRQLTGWSRETWPGFDPAVDYPYIIGHSTTRNVEYLVHHFGAHFRGPESLEAFVQAVLWTLEAAPNEERLEECRETLRVLGLAPHLEHGGTPQDILRAWAPDSAAFDDADWVRMGMEIYYRQLFGHFEEIRQGRGEAVAVALYGPGHRHPIKPLAGLGVLHALAKGWLGAEAGKLAPLLQADATEEACAQLAQLGLRFAQQPVPVALVTASGRYETEVVLPEVFRGLRDEVAAWPVSEACKAKVLAGFATPEHFYDAIVTASDCHELRLKPHRDLYTIALHRLGLNYDEARRVIGFEDTEAGIVALRAAGIGLACAVPFEGTLSHNFHAASHTIPGGLPTVLLQHNLFLSK